LAQNNFSEQIFSQVQISRTEKLREEEAIADSWESEFSRFGPNG
jgi:hypothetical protein